MKEELDTLKQAALAIEAVLEETRITSRPSRLFIGLVLTLDRINKVLAKHEKKAA